MPALLASLSTRGKLLLAGSTLAFLVAAVVLVRMAAAPAFTDLQAGMDPAQTGKVTAALDAKGIGYELRNNGTAIAVDKAQVSQARIALASAGLGQGIQPGFELLDKQKLGASSFQQQVAYQRALEGQIANNLATQIPGAAGAKVSLTLPKEQLFADDSLKPTAAVLLGSDSQALDGAAVKGIANSVAAAVQGLKADAVTITDGTGTMLWPTGDGAGGAGGGGTKQAMQTRYDAQLASQLDGLLTQSLGPDKAHVVVHSDLDVDQATQEQLQYAKKGTPLETTTDTETLTGSGGTAGGAAGTATNLPSYAQTAAGGSGKSNYKHVKESAQLGVDKTVTRKTIAPGKVNRLDVSVVVDTKALAAIPAAGKTPAAKQTSQLKLLTASLTTAAGIQPGLGSVVITPAVFPVAKTPKAPGLTSGPIIGYAKAAGAVLAGLLFLFFITRHLRKREADPFAEEPSWLRELELPSAPRSLPAGDMPTQRLDEYDPQAEARKVFASDPRAIALEDLVAREPEKVAQQLRTWITEDGS